MFINHANFLLKNLATHQYSKRSTEIYSSDNPLYIFTSKPLKINFNVRLDPEVCFPLLLSQRKMIGGIGIVRETRDHDNYDFNTIMHTMDINRGSDGLSVDKIG